MDYTLSNSYDTHVATGNRMHEDAKSIPTVVSAKDMNSVLWSLMELVKAAGLTGIQFDKANPATYQRLLAAFNALYLKRDGSLPMLGALQGKQGAIAANNPNNVGLTFYGDFDSGMFSPADGVLQLATNGVVFFENNASGAARFLKGVRAPKGAPSGVDLSSVSGYSFQDDGDTGMFALGGTANNGSDLAFYIDNAEVGRLKAAMKLAAPIGWARTIGGTIIQWGSFTVSDTGSAVAVNIGFATAFPNGCHQVMVMPGNGLNSGMCATAESWNTTTWSGYTLGSAQARVWRWVAFGY